MAFAASYWEKDRWLRPADVIIVGAGLAGLWTAYELKKQAPNRRVLILEQGTLPTGASTRNAGFACFGSPSELLHDAAMMGESAMLQMVEMRYKGIQKILQVLGSDAIGFEACGGYECFETWPENYNDEIAHLNSLLQPIMQRENTFSMVHHQLESFEMKGFGGMVANPMEGALHSGYYVAALTKLITDLGIDIFYGTKVQNWQVKSNSIQVETSNHIFETAQIIFTSNAYLSQQMPQLNIAPARGQVLVTHPNPSLTMRGTFHFDEGFYYWRHVGGNRILLGGARNHDLATEATTTLETSDNIQQQLEAFLISHLPSHFTAQNIQDKVDMRWSGLMAMSQSKLPLLEQVSPGVWALMCCNGMGVALSPVIAAEMATQVLTNQ